MDNAKEAPSYAVHLSPDGMPRLDARRLDTASSYHMTVFDGVTNVRRRHAASLACCRWMHTTIGYYVKPCIASEEQRYQKRGYRPSGSRRVPVIDLGAPECCLFDSMSEFSTRFLLA